ncbi:hypothetical protein [Streptomyces sp. NPDC017940]|uniref:hypothetical protein n=1 Tax=Streptomyces sp. NPDC017940 TaxID=3365017 RepID=UPI0037956EAB
MAVALAHDGRSWVDGVELRRTGSGTLQDARAAALAHVGRLARERRRPVHVEATEPDGRLWHFVVGPDGDVLEPTDARGLADDPDACTVPPALRPATDEISEAIDSGREHVAMKLARRLQEDLEAEHGPTHPMSLRARELRAHAAYRCGMPGVGCELYIEAARGWLELSSTTCVVEAVQRAYALWHQIQDEPARIAWLGEQLADLLTRGGSERTRAAASVVLRRVDEVRIEGV